MLAEKNFAQQATAWTASRRHLRSAGPRQPLLRAALGSSKRQARSNQCRIDRLLRTKDSAMHPKGSVGYRASSLWSNVDSAGRIVLGFTHNDSMTCSKAAIWG